MPVNVGLGREKLLFLVLFIIFISIVLSYSFSNTITGKAISNDLGIPGENNPGEKSPQEESFGTGAVKESIPEGGKSESTEKGIPEEEKTGKEMPGTITILSSNSICNASIYADARSMTSAEESYYMDYNEYTCNITDLQSYGFSLQNTAAGDWSCNAALLPDDYFWNYTDLTGSANITTSGAIMVDAPPCPPEPNGTIACTKLKQDITDLKNDEEIYSSSYGEYTCNATALGFSPQTDIADWVCNETDLPGDYEWIYVSDEGNYTANSFTNFRCDAAPNATRFSGDTNIEEFVNITNASGLIIEIESLGRIYWPGPINASGADLDNNVFIEGGLAGLDAGALHSTFNSTANITLYNLSYATIPVIYSDGQLCSDCAFFSYSGNNLTFQVSHFTNYTAGANARLIIWDENDPEGGNMNRTTGQNVTFYANYSNVTSGASISSGTCNISFNETPQGPAAMAFNVTSALWEYSRSFATTSVSWNISCNATDYEALNVMDDLSLGQFSCSCSDCSGCTDKLNAPSCTEVYLVANIINNAGTCINSPANFSNKTFDCQGHAIDGDSNGGQGIQFSSKQNITIKNCTITDFAIGIYITSSSDITIYNSNISHNVVDEASGIMMISIYNSNIINNNFSANGLYSIYALNSVGNNFTDNTAKGSTDYGFTLENTSYSRLVGNRLSPINEQCLQVLSHSNYNVIANNNVGPCGDYGIGVSNSSNNTLENNLLNATWAGIYLFDGSSNNKLINNTANSNGDYGIYLYTSSNNRIENSTANNNYYNGISLEQSSNNILKNNTANSNGNDGITISGSSNNSLNGNTAWNNSKWNFYSESDSLNNTVTNMTIASSLKISFDSKDIKLNPASAPASDPAGYQNISKYINSTNNSVDSWIYLNVSYNESELGGVNESRLVMARYDGGWETNTSNFSNVNGVDTAKNFVYANITKFSIFAPFGQLQEIINITNCTTFNSAGMYVIGSDLTTSGHCLIINASNVEIDCQGHSITYTGTFPANYRAVTYDQGTSKTKDRFTLRNCIINNFSQAVYLYTFTNSSFINNTIYTVSASANMDNVYGFKMFHDNERNTFENNSITFVSCSGYAFDTDWSNRGNHTFRNNHINLTKAGYGFSLLDGNNTIYGNDIRVYNGGWGTGISLGSGCFNSTISYNNISVFGNTNRNYSIALDASSRYNLVHHNRILSQASYYIVNNNATNMFNTSVGGVAQGNYYADILDWQIYDTNEDGFGDTGLQYPYNGSMTRWSGSGADWGPMDAKIPVPQIEFKAPTPDNGTITTNRSFGFNISVTNALNMKEFKWNWNGTNYSFYDNNLLLMLNFNNLSALGEDDTKAVDSSMYGNNGTVYNAVWNESGKYGGGYVFNGDNTAINITGLKKIQGVNSEFTIEAWINPAQGGSGAIVTKSIANLDQTGDFILYLEPADRIAFAIYNGGWHPSFIWNPSTTTYVDYNNWSHVVVTHTNQSDGLRVYLNGQLLGNASGLTQTEATNHIVMVGMQGGSGSGWVNRFNGTIDEVRIYNRSLSEAEVLEHYHSNLYNYDTDKWLFYSNQSNLSAGTYNYFGCAANNSRENCTDIRDITILGESAVPMIYFVSPTPDNGTNTTNTSVVINISTVAKALEQFKWNWNEINYTFYDSSLRLMMNFNNNTAIGENGNTTVDASIYSKNGTCSGMGAICNYTDGKFGNALSFDGSDDVVTGNASNFPLNDSARTIMAWIKISDTDGDDKCILHYGIDTGDSPPTNFHLFASHTHKASIGNGFGYGIAEGTTNVDDNKWHFLAGVYEGSGTDIARIYVDGVEEGSTTINTPGTVSGNYQMGGWLGGGGRINGTIDEVRVYNRNLSSGEIRQQYFSNLYKYDTDKWQFYTNQSGFSVGTHSYFGCAANSSGENCTGTRTLEVLSNFLHIFFVPPTPQNNTNATAPVLINISAKVDSLEDFKWNWNGTNNSMYNGSIAMFNFDNDSALGENATNVRDISRYSNNGIISNAVYVSGKNGKALRFYGNSSSHVTVSSLTKSMGQNSSVAAMAWVKLSSATMPDSYIMTKGYAYVDREGDFLLWVKPQTQVFGACLRSGGSWNCLQQNEAIDTAWHHYAFTNNASSFNIYYDGELANNASGVSAIEDTTNYLGIGAQPGSPWFMPLNGIIDEVRIYNRSLTSSEIEQLYSSTLYAYGSNNTDWIFESNQNVTNGFYTYFGCVNDISGAENCTEQRSLTIISPNSTLDIWDQTDNRPYGNYVAWAGENASFYANYTNFTSGEAISSGNCSFCFEGLGCQWGIFNASKGLFETSRNFTDAGVYPWNATCNATDFGTQSESDEIVISGYFNVSNCSAITVPGVYALNQSITASGTCFVIDVPFATLECSGYSITGDGTGSGVSLNSNNAVVRNCTISNFSNGIDAAASTYNLLVYNNVSYNVNMGISLSSSSHNNITENTVDYNINQYGISLSSSSNNIIANNIANNNGVFGINIEGGSNNSIINNKFNNTYYAGIRLYNSNYNNLTNNTAYSYYDIGILMNYNSNYNNLINNTGISDNTAGCYHTECAGILIGSSSYNTLINNTGMSINGYGIRLSGGGDVCSHNNLTNNTASSNNRYAIFLRSADNNILVGNMANNSQRGIYLQYSPDNILTNNIASFNAVWDFYSDDSNNVVVTNLTTDTIKSSFTYSGNIRMKSAANPGSIPSGYNNMGKFLNITNATNAVLWINISYTNDELRYYSVAENTLAMWRYDGSDWSNNTFGTADYGVDTINNVVYANVTNFSIFAPLGEPAPNATLDIWDQTDNMTYGNDDAWAGETVMFYANYTNSTSGAVIAGGNCSFCFEGLGCQWGIFNASKSLFETNWTFASGGIYSWNATCNDTIFGTQDASDEIAILDYYNVSNCGAIISPGVYTLNQSITANDTCFMINASHVTLDCSGHTVRGNSTGSGVLLNASNYCVIENCKLYNFSEGIYAENSLNDTLFSNDVSYNEHYGIELESSNSSNITNNLAIKNLNSSWSQDEGILLFNSYYNNIIANVIRNSSRFDIDVDGDSNQIINNTMNFFYAGGLSLSGSNNIVDGNFIDDIFTGHGMVIMQTILIGSNRDSNNNTFRNNFIWSIEGPISVKIMNGENNTFYNNYINGSVTSSSTNYWNTTYDCSSGKNIVGGRCKGGNYFTRYNGTDNDVDGIGDTNLPYNVSGIYADWLPLVDLYGPEFLNLSNITILEGEALSYDVNASDPNRVSCFWVNDTAHFSIDCSGLLTNNTALGIGLYWLNISVNDSLGNNYTETIYVNVTPVLSIGWQAIACPEGVFEPYNGTAYSGTHAYIFSIKFTELTISDPDMLECQIKVSNGSVKTINATGLNLVGTNYSLNYTVQMNDSIINNPSVGYVPWILKNCSIISGGSPVYTDNVSYASRRIYVHSPGYWADDEVTRAVACAGTPGTYFNNTAKCEFEEDTMFALQMRNGNPVNETCFNNPGIACSNIYCNGIYFPTCDPLDYFGGMSALSDDPNGYTTFTASFASYNVPIVYTRYTNTSGTFKLRLGPQTLSSKTFSITIYNLTNVSGANVYGAETGGGTTSITDAGDGTWNVAHNRLATQFTGTLDLVFNISFDALLNENRNLYIVIAFGTDTNQGNPPIFPANFSTAYGLYNNNESQNTSATTDSGGVCGDEANNDFDYLTGGTWSYSYDCFDQDCNLRQGDDSQTNEFGSGKTGLCNYITELNCTDKFDNDYDYIRGTDYTDCHDTNCFQTDPACPATEIVCNDSINNDWDYTLGETDNSASQKIGNNGTKYDGTHQANLTDCEDIDCDGQVGGAGNCNWGYETNCSDAFNNDALQLKDCELTAVAGSTSMPGQANAEYDCAQTCRITNSTETGTQCNDNLDNDWDAIVVTGYYSDQYTTNNTNGAGIDCRWGGYFGYGTNYNPDEDCNNTVLGNGKTCELQRETNCSDGFDNDYDKDAAGMPNAGWSADTAGYLAYFGVAWSNDADYDDYDCQATAPVNESVNASWCFDNIDNDLDKYHWTGVWTANASTGIDCEDLDCLGITNPSDPNQTCLSYEYNASDTFFTSLPWPGMYCANNLDDDADGPIDCADTDCFKQFDMCSQGPCYEAENKTWSSCADSTDNDYADGTDCADHTDCDGMLGSTSGPICQATETSCGDSFNNDAQGGTDCADHLDCDNQIGGIINNQSVYCRTSESTTSDCFDGFDNDADGSVDCYDTSCNAQCNLMTISGTTPITLPQYSGSITLNGINPTTQARIDQSTGQVRRGEYYNITFKGIAAAGTTQWTIGTAGNQFDKSKFNTSTASLSGPDAGTFLITETANGWTVDSTSTHPGGYSVTFNVQSTTVMSADTYELTYAESIGSLTSMNNNINHKVDEDTAPIAQLIQVSPNNTGIAYGGTVYLRANISDNNALGLCDWYVYGAAIFNPADSTQCRGSFNPTIEGIYYINVTPVDYYSNIGTPISVNYNLNILPVATTTTINTIFYNQTDVVTFNATFNLVGTDTLGTCEVFVKNSSSEISLGSFAASGNNCYSPSIGVSGLADGIYTIFAKVIETTDSNIVESSTTSIFVCSQTTSGICQFADFNSNSKADICDINITEPVMTLSKIDDPDPVMPGNYLNYTISYSNTGQGNATNVTLYETYDQNVTFVSAIPPANVSNNQWHLGTIESGQGGTINITVLVNSSVANSTILANLVNLTYLNSTNGALNVSVTENTTVSSAANQTDLNVTIITISIPNTTKTVTFYNAGTDIVAATNTTIEENMSFTLPAGTYDIYFDAYNSSMIGKLKSVPISADRSDTIILDVANSSLYPRLYGINTSYLFNIAELRLSYENMNYSDENNLSIFVCHAYDISSRNCSSSWESFTVTQNKTRNYFNFSSTSFSGFGINETPATQLNITVVSPLNTSYSSSTLWFNITTNYNASTCKMNLDNHGNVTMQNSSLKNWYNQTTSLSEMLHNITYWCNDTSGLTSDQKIIYFTVDLTKPYINITTPRENETINQSSAVYVNATVNEDASTCKASFDNSTNITLTNSSNKRNWIGSDNLANGNHDVVVYCSDLAGNWNASKKVSFVVYIPSEEEGGGGGTGGGGGRVTNVTNVTNKTTPEEGGGLLPVTPEANVTTPQIQEEFKKVVPKINLDWIWLILIIPTIIAAIVAFILSHRRKRRPRKKHKRKRR